MDFFKGLLIWSVVLGHTLNVLCPTENSLHMLLRTFDLPMFMYISGFLLRGSLARHHWKQLVVNKVTNIIIPAIVWMLISLLFGDHCMYYFLWAVFASSVLVCVCAKIGMKSWMREGILALIAVSFHLIPLNVVNISFLFPFFLFGYYTEKISSVGWIRGVLSLVVFVVLFVYVWRPEYTIWSSGGYILQDPGYMVGVVSLRLIIGMAGIYATIFVMGKLYDLYGKTRCMNLFVGIGKETLSLYLLQHIVVEIGMMRLVASLNVNNVLTAHHLLIGYVIAPLISFVLLLVMYYAITLIQASKYTKWVFGFKLNLVTE